MFDTSLKAQKHLETMTRRKEKEQDNLKALLSNKNAKKVAVSIPPIYSSRLGSNLPLTLGVETITIPVNGRTYLIPEGFAEILKKHLHQIDLEELRSRGKWGDNRGDVSATGPIPGQK